MSDGIVISSAIRSNLLALQNTAALQATTQNRLATGKKVSSALDNATSFFTAAAFTSRAGQLSGLLDSIGNAIQTLKAADTGINSINKLVDNLRATARQALQAPSAYSSRASVTSSAALPTGATAADLRGANTAATVTGSALGTATSTTLLSAMPTAFAAGDTITVNGTTINVVASGATGNDVNVGDAMSVLLGKIATAAGSGATASIDATSHRVTVTAGDTSTALTLGGSAIAKLGLTAATTAAGSGAPALEGRTLTFAVGSGATQTFTFSSSNKSLDDLNTFLSASGLTASLDSAGKLTVTTTSQTESKTFTVGGTGATLAFGAASPSVSSPVRTGSGAASRDGFVSQFNGLLTQIDSIAKDASFNGVNLLKGDTLSVVFNETSTSKLDIKGTTFDSAGLGVSAIASADFNDGNAINAVIAKLDAATSTLQAQGSKFGSNLSIVQTRQDFSKNLINTLQAGADGLTLADTNEEAANLLALQTRQQLSQSALSLANQAAQGVLRLF